MKTRNVEQLLDFRDHGEQPVASPHIQRLNPQSVSAEDGGPTLRVQQHEAPHPAHALEASRPPLGKRREHHLGVALGAKGVTESLQLGTELEIIIDLAIVREPVAVAVDHRLRRRRAQVGCR